MSPASTIYTDILTKNLMPIKSDAQRTTNQTIFTGIKQMRFLIYGAGALGQAMGCLLAADGHEVDLVLRQRFIAKILQDGLKVGGIFGNYKASFSKSNLMEKIDQAEGHYDYVLLTTKAYDTETAIDDIQKIAGKVDSIVSMQNGCGNIEMLKHQFGSEKTLGARVITGFEIESTGQVSITVSADAIHVGGCNRGPSPQKVLDLAAAIASAGHPCTAVEDVYQSLYSKLLYNCTLNPLGAILGVHYGLLVEQQETKDIMDRVIEETFDVITALGGTTDWPDAASYRRVFYDKLIPATYNHRPSMLQDLENKKPTEIDALSGYVSQQGRLYQVPTPTGDLLASLVKFKENR